MKIFFLILMFLHGLIHMMGFSKAFGYAELNQVSLPISRPAGLIWLLTTLLFLLAAILWITNQESWWWIGGIAILVSQALVFIYWKDAKAGTIANLLLILPIIISGMKSLPGSFANRYQEEAEKRISEIRDSSILSSADIQHLPVLVQNYLYVTGSVGKPKVKNLRARFDGSMKRTMNSNWMDIEAWQSEYFEEPARLFYIESSVFGIPFDGFHFMSGHSARMQIKVASLFQVVDASGEKMNQGETVTLFNDMCLLAPSTLIDSRIQWEPIDSHSVRARFTNHGISITAVLIFNEAGELINFYSDDRFLSPDGKTYLSYRWSTPCRNYMDYGGWKLASEGETIWHTPEGEFCYGRFELQEMQYNL
jgi:hypothetical protein